jgi:hypothetical protein
MGILLFFAGWFVAACLTAAIICAAANRIKGR